MQTITRASSNNVVFTLTERVTLTTPYFLVSAKSRRTSEVKRFILSTNLSAFTDRYDKFIITESSSEILTSGTVTLTGGDWHYKIYEQESATNLNESGITTLLEEGILRVIDDQDTYISTNTGDTYVY